jgi:hypothetical protein
MKTMEFLTLDFETVGVDMELPPFPCIAKREIADGRSDPALNNGRAC